jgi:hypothetical protein
MNLEERQRIIDRIVNGYDYLILDNQIYRIEDIRPSHRQMGHIIYKQKYEELSINRGISEVEATFRLRERGIWSLAKETQYNDLHTEICDLKESLVDLQFKSETRAQTITAIKTLEQTLKSLSKEKNSLVVNTIEYIASIEKYKFFVSILTRDIMGKLIWPTYEYFLQHSSDKLVNKIINDVYFSDKITEAVVRELARTDPWKTIWMCGNKSSTIFNGPSGEWTDFQKALATWSIIYDNSMECSEPPDDDIVQNDYMFDGWLLKQVKKRKGEAKPPQGIDTNAQEIGIPVESVEDAKRVYNMNSGASKKVLRQRSQAIVSKGLTDIMDLPDVKQKYQMELNKLKRGN